MQRAHSSSASPRAVRLAILCLALTGVVVAALPWARPGSRFTTAFEDTAAWLVCHATLSVVAVLLRVAWRSVADIVTRVVSGFGAITGTSQRRISADAPSTAPAA